MSDLSDIEQFILNKGNTPMHHKRYGYGYYIAFEQPTRALFLAHELHYFGDPTINNLSADNIRLTLVNTCEPFNIRLHVQHLISIEEMGKCINDVYTDTINRMVIRYNNEKVTSND